jgi:hypothetical protein
MIDIEVTNTDLWKYVDDTSDTTEIVERNKTSNIQLAVSELAEKSQQNKL